MSLKIKDNIKPTQNQNHEYLRMNEFQLKKLYRKITIVFNIFEEKMNIEKIFHYLFPLSKLYTKNITL